MRRFLLFAGSGYYPQGGMLDLVFQADSEQACREHFNSVDKDEADWDWGHIFDSEKGKIVMHMAVGESTTYWGADREQVSDMAFMEHGPFVPSAPDDINITNF